MGTSIHQARQRADAMKRDPRVRRQSARRTETRAARLQQDDCLCSRMRSTTTLSKKSGTLWFTAALMVLGTLGLLMVLWIELTNPQLLD
jgi:hypothetical protein